MSTAQRIRRALLGAPKDPTAPDVFHKVSLIAVLAWVGLGADGLSSSAYGPEEAYRQLGEHQGLAVFLALAMAATVAIISYGYSLIIEQFPAGGGGYVVASKILGSRVGVVSGSALLVDYVLTITISVASGADAVFSFLPEHLHGLKLPFTFLGLAILSVLNLRGVKESVTAIAPVFFLFIVTHAILLIVAIGGHVPQLVPVSAKVAGDVQGSVATLGVFGTLQLLLRAYSLGGGTYTGIEAVSNGVATMREPKVQTARRTMVLMAVSLAVTAAGILLSYLLMDVQPVQGQTMNAVLFDRVAGGFTLGGVRVGYAFVVVSLLSEGALLLIAAQAGFIDGPRVMANMATDSWLPHRFSALSERLAMRNGVILMAGSSALAMLYTGGDVGRLVVMYAINVFVTFSLSNIAMSVYWVRHRAETRRWRRYLTAHVAAAALCVTILVVTVLEKFLEGAWLTLVVTASLTIFCFLVRRHYFGVVRSIRALDHRVPDAHTVPEVDTGLIVGPPTTADPDPALPVAILFVGGYSGLGRHALLSLLRMFPGHFRGVVFASIAVVDSDVFKGTREIAALEDRTVRDLESYVRFGRLLGLACTSAHVIGTEVGVEAARLGIELSERYPKGLVVAGQLIFEEDTTWHRLLHNETAVFVQRRLQNAGVPMIVIPVDLGKTRAA